MRNTKLGYKTGTEKKGTTGDELALDLFTEGWSSSSEIKERQEVYSTTNYPKHLMEKGDESATATLETSYQQIQDRLTDLELLVKSLINNKVSHAREHKEREDSGHLDEQWLFEWESEEPHVFMSKKQIKEEILWYEKKYGLMSETLLELVREDSAPDNNEISDWLILLELLDGSDG